MTTSTMFHNMRGDVYDGNTIQFNSGRILRLVSGSGCNWWLVNHDGGERVAGPFDGWLELETWINKNP